MVTQASGYGGVSFQLLGLRPAGPAGDRRRRPLAWCSLRFRETAALAFAPSETTPPISRLSHTHMYILRALSSFEGLGFYSACFRRNSVSIYVC